MAFLRSRAPAAPGASGPGAPGPAGPAVVVAINAGEAAVPLPLDVPELAGRRLVAVTWPGMPAPPDLPLVEGGRVSVTIPPRAGLVLRADAV